MTAEIQIPPEAKLKYVERRKKDLSDCRQALIDQDFACFERVGHQMKGNAVTFGFDQLTPIAINMENLGKKKDLKGLQSVLDLFESELNKLDLAK